VFQFYQFNDLSDQEIRLIIDDHLEGNRAMDRVPAYKFRIERVVDEAWVGDIDVRIGDTRHLIMYGGHIGYSVFENFRGHRYAAKACQLIKEVALFHGKDTLWITCNPENMASRKTCELVGAEYVNTVDVPAGTDLYNRGEYRKCRYQWEIRDSSVDIKI